MKPLYRYSFQEAQNLNEVELWRNSKEENIRCSEFIDNAIKERFDGKHLTSAKITIADIIKEFGYDRTMWVLATTIRQHPDDVRISQENKDWAKSFILPDVKDFDYSLKSHIGLVNIAATSVQQQYKSLGLYDYTHCISDGDYTNQIIVLRADSLKEEYRTPENQLFLAQGGFGCNPQSRGRKIFGIYLNDGESCSVVRTDVCGVISPEHLPEWAKDKAAELLSGKSEDTEDECPEM